MRKSKFKSGMGKLMRRGMPKQKAYSRMNALAWKNSSKALAGLTKKSRQQASSNLSRVARGGAKYSIEKVNVRFNPRTNRYDSAGGEYRIVKETPKGFEVVGRAWSRSSAVAKARSMGAFRTFTYRDYSSAYKSRSALLKGHNQYDKAGSVYKTGRGYSFDAYY